MTSKILITGISGSGKTTLFKAKIFETPARCRFVFDHDGDLADRLKVQRIQTLEELNVAVKSAWCCFDPSVLFPGDNELAFDFFCKFAFEQSNTIGGQKIFAVDELQKIIGTAKVSKELAMIVETGRRRGIHFICVSQQPNLIHNRVRNQMTEVCTFNQFDKNALGYLEFVGFDAGEVQQLGKGCFLEKNLLTQQISRKKIPLTVLGR